MDYAEEAARLFVSGYNCSQSVALAFRDKIPVDTDTLEHLSAPLGAGIGGLRESCGAVAAMCMVLGFLNKDRDTRDITAKTELYHRCQALADRFSDEFGSVVCRELLHIPVGSRPDPKPRTAEYYKSRPCMKFVSFAAKLIQEELDLQEKKEAVNGNGEERKGENKEVDMNGKDAP